MHLVIRTLQNKILRGCWDESKRNNLNHWTGFFFLITALPHILRKKSKEVFSPHVFFVLFLFKKTPTLSGESSLSTMSFPLEQTKD